MNPFEFARLVELARLLRREIPPYCPLCGCVNVRWAGCDNSWHSLRTPVRSASVGGQQKTDPHLAANWQVSPLAGVLDTKPIEEARDV